VSLTLSDAGSLSLTWLFVWHVEVEHRLLLVAEDCRGGNADHEGLDALSRAHVYPDALSPSLRVSILEKAAENAAHDKRTTVQCLIGIRVVDGQYLGTATELDTLRRSGNQRPWHRNVYCDIRVACHVASFRCIGAGRNLQV